MSAPEKPHQNSKPYLPSVSIPPSTSMHIRIPTQTPTVTWSLLGRRPIGRRGRRPILALGRRTIGRSGSGLTLSHGLGGENNVDSIESGSWPCFSSRSPFVAISHVFAESQLFCTAPLLDRFLSHHPAVLNPVASPLSSSSNPFSKLGCLVTGILAFGDSTGSSEGRWNAA